MNNKSKNSLSCGEWVAMIAVLGMILCFDPLLALIMALIFMSVAIWG